MLIFYIHTAVALPVCTSTAVIESSNPCVFLGNCSIDHIFTKTIVPQTLWDKESILLDLVYVGKPNTRSFEKIQGYSQFCIQNKTRAERIYGLASHDKTKKSILYQIDRETQQETAYYELSIPIQKGSLAVYDAYYFNHWHTILILSAEVPLLNKNTLLLFDITDPSKPLEPGFSFNFNGSLAEARPLLLRWQDGHFSLVAAVHEGGEGIIHIIHLENLVQPLQVKVGSKMLSFVIAVDVRQDAVVDRLYVTDQDGIWVIDLSRFDRPQIALIAKVKLDTPPIAIPDAKGRGIRLYFIGRVNDSAKGLCQVLDIMKHKQEPYSALILEGNFKALIPRFGRLVLIDQDIKQLPLVLTLPDHHLHPVLWERNTFSQSQKTQEEILWTKLIWDPKAQKEHLYILNTSCQLTILTASLHQDKYGRMAWRKLD